jgi:hypothetical protein
MTASDWIWYGFASAVGLLASIVELHSGDPQLPVLFLLVLSALFGFAQPVRAWRWAILITIWIPLLHGLNSMVSFPSPRELNGLARLFVTPLVVFFRCTWCQTESALSQAAGSCLALLPSLVGAYAGVWLSRLTASAATATGSAASNAAPK